MSAAVSGMVATVSGLAATVAATNKSNGGFREALLSFVNSDWFDLLLVVSIIFLWCRFFRLLFGGDKDE